VTSVEAMRPAISLDRVTKRYRTTNAGVFGLSLDVEPGQVFGFLGPNGAGKTTTIRLLLDLIRADSGRISVLGLDAHRDSVELRRRIGYLPGELALYDQLSARELLCHFASLRGGLKWAGIEPLVARFGLDADAVIRSLSKGNKQKVGLIQALMGEPELLVLDEPTSGLDPLVQHEVHECIRERSRAGGAVFLSSHALAEVASIADRVGIIREGRLVTTETVADLAIRSAHHVAVTFAERAQPEWFAGVGGLRNVVADGNTLSMDVCGSVDTLVKALAGHEIVDLTVREPSLEEAFLEYYSAPVS
jgi:ABC-2 type transport system ATP-binding protein